MKINGYILITTFSMLLILMVMIVSLISYNSIQMRIAANAMDEQISFNTAEGALNQAINNVSNGVYSSSSFSANTAGLYTFNPNTTPLPSSVNWNSNAVIQSYQGTSSATAAFIIEELPPGIQSGQSMNSKMRLYRITARAVGLSGGSEVILQAMLQVVQ